jgi:hypothetical protein
MSLLSLSIRSGFGCQNLGKESTVGVRTNEFIFSMGSRLALYDNNWQRNMLYPSPSVNFDVVSIYLLKLSPDLRYLSTSVVLIHKKMSSNISKPQTPSSQSNNNTCSMLIYDTLDSTKKPVLFEYTLPLPTSSRTERNLTATAPINPQIMFTCCAFSNDDSVLIAAATNILTVGVLIYDRIMGTLLNQVAIISSLLSSISFNPKDSSRICVTGSNNCLQFWKFSNKSLFSAPIIGLPKFNCSYTCHAWASDNQIIAGAENGVIVLVTGVEVVLPICYAFGAPNQIGTIDTPIASILIREDIIVAISNTNVYSIFELKRLVGAGKETTVSLLLLDRFKVSDVSSITSMQWKFQRQSSTEVFISSPTQMSFLDLKANDYKKVSGTGIDAASPREVASIQSKSSQSSRIKNNIDIYDGSPVDWIEIKTDKTPQRFHAGFVNSLGTSVRTSSFLTLSDEDNTVRLWDYGNSVNPGRIVDQYSDVRKPDMPLDIDLHPSGSFAVLGCDNEIRECSITSHGLETVRRIKTKKPFTNCHGTPFVNTLPVSIVRYSHGGHLLAIVTGRIAQIFHMFNFDYSIIDYSASPSRELVISDVNASITDLNFSRDDSMIFTTCSDGAVYSWKMSEKGLRDGEYIYKGVPATKIIVGSTSDKDTPIIACYESTPSDGNSTLGSISNITRRSSIKMVKKNSIVKTDGNLTNNDSNSRKLNSRDGNESEKLKYFLVFWKGNITPTGETIIYLETPVTCISLSTLDGNPKTDICVLGFIDGRVLISSLPLPLKVLNPNPQIAFSGHFHSDSPGTKLLTNSSGLCDFNEETEQYLNENSTHCKHIQLHSSAVVSVAISASSLWVISTGADGSIFFLATNSKSKELTEIPEYVFSNENNFISTEKTHLLDLETRLHDVHHLIEDKQRECDNIMIKDGEVHHREIEQLKIAMEREVKKRDIIILNCREEQSKISRELKGEIQNLKYQFERNQNELEVSYEQKLTQESLYLETMRQAYDEHVLHSRLDLKELEKQSEKKQKKLNEKSQLLVQDADQKNKVVLEYVDFVNDRNQEVLLNLENAQDKERIKLKSQIKDLTSDLEITQRKVLEIEAKSASEVHELNFLVSNKENEIMRLTSDVDWANGRIKTLESTMNTSTSELKKRTDVSEKWEYKAGEQQMQINELERIRKALTSQLHALRQEIGPKEEKLMEVSERLQEVDREYEQTLQSISDKEKNLLHQSTNMSLLQKQVRDLRTSSSRKDSALRRAAMLFEEYKHVLRQHYFNSKKRTVPLGTNPSTVVTSEEKGNEEGVVSGDIIERKKVNVVDKTEIIEIIVKSESLDLALQRLNDVLSSYSKAEEKDAEAEFDLNAATKERERHIDRLHKNVEGLKYNLDFSSVVAKGKITHHVADNTVLLEEVNSMRHEIRTLSNQNKTLKAKVEYSESKKRRSGSQSQLISTSENNPKLLPRDYYENNQVTNYIKQSQSVPNFNNNNNILEEVPQVSNVVDIADIESINDEESTIDNSKTIISANSNALLEMNKLYQKVDDKLSSDKPSKKSLSSISKIDQLISMNNDEILKNKTASNSMCNSAKDILSQYILGDNDNNSAKSDNKYESNGFGKRNQSNNLINKLLSSTDKKIKKKNYDFNLPLVVFPVQIKEQLTSNKLKPNARNPLKLTNADGEINKSST